MQISELYSYYFHFSRSQTFLTLTRYIQEKQCRLKLQSMKRRGDKKVFSHVGQQPCLVGAAVCRVQALPHGHLADPYCRCFINRTSKFIRLPRCSRKTMVAYNRHEDLYWFRPEPYIQPQRRSSACSSLECS